MIEKEGNMKILLNTMEASELSGLSKDKIYELIHTDPNFPKLKVGKNYKVNSVLLAEYLNEKTRKGDAIK